MPEHETLSFNSLNLSWPHCVNYHADSAAAGASNSSFGNGSGARGTGEEPVETYNGVRREYIRNAQPLFGNEIRVLDLRSGSPEMPLVGSLRRVCLSDRLSNRDVYEPLSYTWEDCDTVQDSLENTGDDSHPRLFLMDTGYFGSLKLTSNCAEALRSVRKSQTERTIWVDSICVNQDDPEERSRQVDLMKEIYAKAFTVLVYLGRESTEDDDSSRKAMLLLRQPDRLRDFFDLEKCEQTSLKRLFERRYFRRMWIVQEVALAQTIEFYCGPEIAYVSEFAGNPLNAILGFQVTPPWLRHSKQAASELPIAHQTLLAHLRSQGIDPRRIEDSERTTIERSSAHQTALAQLRYQGHARWLTRSKQEASEISSAHQTSQAQQILGLIFDTAFCNCKDDRDRIFAILGLLNCSDKERLRADYNLSTAQVYTGIAAYLAKNGFLWVVLILAPPLSLDNYRDHPSWVPRWSNVGEVGIQPHPCFFHQMLSMSHRPVLYNGFEIFNSGVITIRGMLLGPVTHSDDIRGMLFGSAADDGDHREHLSRETSDSHRSALIVDLFLNDERNQDRKGSLWTLAKPNHLQDKSLDSWKCHFEFLSHCKQPIKATHVALLLPDYLTVLILRPGNSFCGLYTLVQSGLPIVWASQPIQWSADSARPHPIHLSSFSTTPDLKGPYLDTIRSSKELFARLSRFPEFWGYNPLTSTVTLTDEAIRSIRSTSMSELSVMEIWWRHARTGVQVFRDETRLRFLIDEVDSLCHQDYIQIEEAATLEQKGNLPVPPKWPLDRFLGLFIRDPFKRGPVAWPDVKLHSDQPRDETAVLQQLMQWAQVFFHLVYQAAHGSAGESWAQLPRDHCLCSDAWNVGSFQVSMTEDASHGRDRTSILLRKILHQVSEDSNSELEQIQGPRSKDECYWDWRRFNSVLEQRFCSLSHIRPEVEKIQADLRDFRPDITLHTHRVLAAHGLDPSKKSFTQIKIR